MRNAATTLRTVQPNLMNMTWTLGSEDGNFIAMYSLVRENTESDKEEHVLERLPKFSEFRKVVSQKLWTMISTGLAKALGTDDFICTLKALVAADVKKAMVELAVVGSTATLDKCDTAMPIWAFIHDQLPGLEGLELKVGEGNAQIEVSFGCLCLAPVLRKALVQVGKLVTSTQETPTLEQFMDTTTDHVNLGKFVSRTKSSALVHA